VTDCQALPANVRRRLAGLIVEALLARPVWSAEGTTMFHADPHAGNLLATADGRLAILDWSLVGHLSKDQQTAMTQILIGAATLDAGRIHRAIAALAVGGADGPALAAVVDGGIARLQRDPWPGLGWLTWLLDEAVVAARARFAADLVMFRKVLHTLQGVVADVSESCRIDSVLARSMLTRVGVESGWRTLAPPFSHAFASHVSNAEITHVLASAPLILLRALLRLTDGTSADGVPAVSR
jgi:ubiquinone biosynthesis protein